MNLKIRSIIILAWLMFILISCNFKNNSLKGTVEKDNYFAFDVNELQVVGDTIIVISSDNHLFFPFGESDKNEIIQNIFSKYGFDKQIIYAESDTIFKFIKNNSFCTLFKTASEYDDKINFQVIEAKITENLPLFSNVIKIGMYKKDFIKLFRFAKTQPNISNINCVKMSSARIGIFYEFYFNENQLTKIIIDSDYHFN